MMSSIRKNCRKSEGRFGRLVLRAMNHGFERFARSVCMKRERNVKRLGKECYFRQNDVMVLSYPKESYDMATALETIYFGQTLKPGGRCKGISILYGSADSENDGKDCI